MSGAHGVRKFTATSGKMLVTFEADVSITADGFVATYEPGTPEPSPAPRRREYGVVRATPAPTELPTAVPTAVPTVGPTDETAPPTGAPSDQPCNGGGWVSYERSGSVSSGEGNYGNNAHCRWLLVPGGPDSDWAVELRFGSFSIEARTIWAITI